MKVFVFVLAMLATLVFCTRADAGWIFNRGSSCSACQNGQCPTVAPVVSPPAACPTCPTCPNCPNGICKVDCPPPMPVKLPLIPKPASTTPQAYPGPQPGPHPHPWPFYPPQPQPVVYPWPVINPATGGYWGYTPYVGPVATVTLGSACCTERVRFQRGPVRRFFGRLFGR